jgi:PHP family Zn ribbon phosphoesterase
MEEENRNLLRKYREIQEEINNLRDQINRHNKGDVMALHKLTYLQAIKKLSSLRRKMNRCPKNIRRII